MCRLLFLVDIRSILLRKEHSAVVAVVDDVDLFCDGRFDGRQQVFPLERRLFLLMLDALDAIQNRKPKDLEVVFRLRDGIEGVPHEKLEFEWDLLTHATGEIAVVLKHVPSSFRSFAMYLCSYHFI